jgi:hypothetical protein
MENSFLSIVASIRVYGAVAWQRLYQICYIVPSLRLFAQNSLTVHHPSFLSGAVLSTFSGKLFFSFFPR